MYYLQANRIMSSYLMPLLRSLTNGNTEYGLIAQAEQGRFLCSPHCVTYKNKVLLRALCKAEV